MQGVNPPKAGALCDASAHHPDIPHATTAPRAALQVFVALLRAVPSTEKQRALAREIIDVVAPVLQARKKKGASDAVA